ncbi:MAG: hypothetical protein NTW86_10100 [Candidatus Sumerlaeota bacterium]|nr:hypothetical protein [Candidatus Sumerlaeota bacterium]
MPDPTPSIPAGPSSDAPRLDSVNETSQGALELHWRGPARAPAQYVAFAWDFYAGEWVRRGCNGTPWFPFLVDERAGAIDLGLSGAYHVWISAQYSDGAVRACPNPWTGALLDAPPHTPREAWAEPLGGRRFRLRWKPDLFGVWQYQILAWKTDAGWVLTQGPGGNALWHFVDYGEQAPAKGSASFREGWANLTLPAAGSYWIFIRGVGWRPPHPAGEFAGAFAAAP